MPTVPLYSSPQVQETSLPGARQESIATPALLDAGAEKQAAFGKGIEEAGSALSGIAYHMDQRNIADGLFKTMASDKEAYLQYQQDVEKNRQGDGAQGVTKDTAAWWKERINKNLEGMTNGELQRLYQKHSTELQLQSLNNMSHFEVAQTDSAQQQNFKADKINTINMVSANPSDTMVKWGVADIKKKNDYMAAQKNWSPELKEAMNTDDLTNFHKQVIQTLAAGDQKDKAVAYFDAHKDEIAGSQQAEIGQFAQKATAAAVATKAVDALWSSDGPKSDTDPVNVDQMAAKIREQFKDQTYTRDAALTELHQRRAEFLQGAGARGDNQMAAVNTMFLEGKSMAAIQQTPAWAALNGTQQLHIKQSRESYLATVASRAASNESRAFASEQRQELRLNTAGIDTKMRLSDPDKLLAMSRDQVINLAPTIGTHNTQELLNRWDTFTKNGTALSEAKIDNDQFKVFAQRAGLDITPKTDVDKEKLITLRDQVDRIIGQEQQARKRPLTREERDAVLQKQIDNTVMQHNWLSSDTAVPAIALPASEAGEAYVMAGGQKVKLASIPATDRAAIVSARQRAGLPVTEQAIAEMYMKKKNGAK